MIMTLKSVIWVPGLFIVISHILISNVLVFYSFFFFFFFNFTLWSDEISNSTSLQVLFLFTIFFSCSLNVSEFLSLVQFGKSIYTCCRVQFHLFTYLSIWSTPFSSIHLRVSSSIIPRYLFVSSRVFISNVFSFSLMNNQCFLYPLQYLPHLSLSVSLSLSRSFIFDYYYHYYYYYYYNKIMIDYRYWIIKNRFLKSCVVYVWIDAIHFVNVCHLPNSITKSFFSI